MIYCTTKVVQVCRNLVNTWRLAFYYFPKTSMAIKPTTKLSSYTISARLCYPVKSGSQLAFPHSNTGIAGSNPWQTPWCTDVFLYVVLACGDRSLGFVIMSKARLHILTKKKKKGRGQCFPASAIIPSNPGMPDGRYDVFWAVTQTPNID